MRQSRAQTTPSDVRLRERSLPLPAATHLTLRVWPPTCTFNPHLPTFKGHWPDYLAAFQNFWNEEIWMGHLRIQSHALWRPRGNSIKPQAVQEEIEARPSMLPQGTGNPDCEARALCQRFPSVFNTLTWETEFRPKKIIPTSGWSQRQQCLWWRWRGLKAEQPGGNPGESQPQSCKASV